MFHAEMILLCARTSYYTLFQHVPLYIFSSEGFNITTYITHTMLLIELVVFKRFSL